jgi:UDP-glucose 4-epimerase
MRILVTGATGFLGQHLLPLLAGRHEPVALARREPPPELGKLADWITGDLSGPVDRISLPEGIDAVVHLAQSERYREFPAGAGDVFAVNVASTFGLLEYARRAGAKRFVHASTGGVYRPSAMPLTEESAIDPRGLYAASKAAAERLVAGYSGLLETEILRPFFVYGPGREDMLVATLTGRVLDGQAVEVAGDPGIRLTPTYVDDAARAFAAALAVEGGQTVNVAGSEAVTLTELVELIADAAGVRPEIRHVDGGGGDLVADNGRMRELLGVTPGVSLREGLGSVVAATRGRHGLTAG